MSKFFEALERAERERAQRKNDRDGVAASLTKEDLRKDVAEEPRPADLPPAPSRPRVSPLPEAPVSASVTKEVRPDVAADRKAADLPPAPSRPRVSPLPEAPVSASVTKEVRPDVALDRKAADLPPSKAPEVSVSASVTKEKVRPGLGVDRKPADIPPPVRRAPVPSAPPIPEVSTSAPPPVLPTQELPGSSIAESFRVLQANLIRALLEAKIRRVLVTSASGGEGRSTVVANLGVALSQSEQRVLIIDADVRRAQQHRLFDLGRSPGLVDYLLAEASLADVVRRTATRGLSLITAGRPVAAPAEPLSSRRMSELLEFSATQFDVVLLDAPAVLDVADTRVLAPLADGVLVVARAGTVTREALRQVRRSLQQVHARVLGVVLNQLPDARARSAE
jgi:capsular exopolysaccharide synthesis family protein